MGEPHLEEGVGPRDQATGSGGEAAGLVLALLTIGLFAGSAVFHESPSGLQWFEQASRCDALPVVGPDGLVDPERVAGCASVVTGPLVGFQLAGMAAGILVTLALAWLAPRYVVRRRRLTTLPEALTATVTRVGELAVEAGVRRPPALMVGPVSQRDAFVFGRPGRYRLALPLALAVRPGRVDLFDPVVRHELAHLRRHDVLLAWSTRPALLVGGGLLALPLVVAVADRDASLLPAYAWRAALLLAATVAIGAGILRSREYEADSQSAGSAPTRTALVSLLAGMPPTLPRRRAGWLALHPSRQQRVDALSRPRPGLRPAAAFSAALLGGFVVPLVDGLVADRLAWADRFTALAPAIGGVALGACLGPALWRAAGCGRLSRRAAAMGTLCTLAGWLVGSTGSLSRVGDGPVALAELPTDLLTAAAAAGGVALTTTIALLTASAAIPAWTQRAAAVSICSVMVGSALWWAHLLVVAEGAGRVIVLQTIVSFGGTVRFTALLSSVCALIVVLAVRTRTGLGRAATAYMVLGAAISLGVIIAYRSAAGPVSDLAHAQQRLDVYVWICAAASGSLAPALGLRAGGRGLGLALAAGTGASVLTGLGLGVLNTVLGGKPTFAFFFTFARVGIGLGFLLLLGAALVWSLCGLVPQRSGTEPLMAAATSGASGRRRALLTATLLAIVLAASDGGLLLARGALSPLPPAGADAAPSTSDMGPRDASDRRSDAQERRWYRAQWAPAVEARLEDVAAIDAVLLGPASSPPAPWLVRRYLLSPIRETQALVDLAQVRDRRCVASQEALRTALSQQVLAYRRTIAALRGGRPTQMREAAAERARAAVEVVVWRATVADLD